MREPHTIGLSALSICGTGFVFRLAFPMTLPLPLGMLTSLSAAFFPAILSLMTFLLEIMTIARELLGQACRIGSVLPQVRRLLARFCLSSVIVVYKSCHYDIGGEV